VTPERASCFLARRVAIPTAIGYRSALGFRSAAPVVSLGPVPSASLGGIGEAHALTLRRSRRRIAVAFPSPLVRRG